VILDAAAFNGLMRDEPPASESFPSGISDGIGFGRALEKIMQSPNFGG
jgi:hypothetical protein